MDLLDEFIFRFGKRGFKIGFAVELFLQVLFIITGEPKDNLIHFRFVVVFLTK